MQRHYYKHLKGRGDLYQLLSQLFLPGRALCVESAASWINIPQLQDFAGQAGEATLAAIEDGVMTKDLAQITTLDVTVLNSHAFIGAIRKQL